MARLRPAERGSGTGGRSHAAHQPLQMQTCRSVVWLAYHEASPAVGCPLQSDRLMFCLLGYSGPDQQSRCPLQDPVPMQAPDSAGPQSGRHRSHDLVTLGNLCVDIVLEVPELPSPDVNQRKLLLRQLTASAPPQEVRPCWWFGEGEAGWGGLLDCSPKLRSWHQRRQSVLLLPQRQAELPKSAPCSRTYETATKRGLQSCITAHAFPSLGKDNSFRL